MLKLKRMSTQVSLAVFGAAYSNIFLKGYAAIVPVQLLVLIYGFYLIYNQKF
jgi:hypothetical protein